MRKNFSTNTPSELRVGYSRAVRINNTLYVSGTTSINEQGTVVGKTLYEQTKFIFEKINTALKEAEFKLQDVVRICVFITDMQQLPEFDRAFKEIFFEIKPACTLVGVSALVANDLLVEIEATAQKSV